MARVPRVPGGHNTFGPNFSEHNWSLVRRRRAQNAQRNKQLPSLPKIEYGNMSFGITMEDWGQNRNGKWYFDIEVGSRGLAAYRYETEYDGPQSFVIPVATRMHTGLATSSVHGSGSIFVSNLFQFINRRYDTHGVLQDYVSKDFHHKSKVTAYFREKYWANPGYGNAALTTNKSFAIQTRFPQGWSHTRIDNQARHISEKAITTGQVAAKKWKNGDGFKFEAWMGSSS
tara:strand:+ start:94173 stop:94859 length:687 start_codon:yes stop_codon:yes gene_type:complete